MSQTSVSGIKMLKLPEYFAEYREMGNKVASFLGSSIVAKVRLHYSLLWHLRVVV